MPPIVMYSSDRCPYCRMAKALLDGKNAPYQVLDVDRNPQLWLEMTRRTDRNTIPQIFIGERHVGGFDDLAALERKGALDPLLAG